MRANWWCGFARRTDAPDDVVSRARVAPYETPYTQRYTWRVEPPLRGLHPTPDDVASPPFVAAADRETAARELSALRQRGAAPSELAQAAVRFARANPSDPRAPEVLHLAVRATRYGCPDDQNGRRSKAAFDLLHRQYPRSEWAKRTPYWFK